MRASAGLILIAATALAQTTPDPTEVLSQARAKVADTMKRLPKYACLQTIDRTFYTAPKVPNGEASCDRWSTERKNQKPRVTETDRLRLDVAEGHDIEIHSWPGASRFDLTDIDQIVDHGAFSTGALGAHLVNIFVNSGTDYDYRGEETLAGHRVFRYGYAVARVVSHYQVKDGDSWYTAAYSGDFEVDPDTYELLRLTIQTEELPAGTNICQAATTLHYQRVTIGDGTFLLPRESQVRALLRNGEESNNATTFAGCREFHAESAVRFGDAPDEAAPGSAPAKTRGPMPRDLQLELRLQAAIDTDTAAAGDPITATVVHDVRAPQGKNILMPAGTVVHGRIAHLEHRLLPTEQLLIGVLFESVEIGRESAPFAARLQQTVSGGLSVSGSRGRSSTMQIDRVVMAESNTFVFPLEKRHVITAGTTSEWVTVDAAAGTSKRPLPLVTARC